MATDSDAEELEDDDELWDEEELLFDLDVATDSDLDQEALLDVDLLEDTAIQNIVITNKPIRTLYLSAGDTYPLEVEVTPEDATEVPQFVSNDETVATVSSDGVITAIADGSCTVRVRSEATSDSIWFYVKEHAVQVTLNANGGTFSDGETMHQLYGEAGNYMGLYDQEPEQENWVFNGWYQEAECINLVTDKTYFHPETDMELFAGWSDSYTITYDYDGIAVNGALREEYKVPQGKQIDSKYPYIANDDPSKTGDKLLKGWTNEAGTLISRNNLSSYVPQGDETLTAVWSDYYTILFDYGGATYNGRTQSKAYVIQGEKGLNDPDLPEDLRSGESLIFGGWMTESGSILSNSNIYNYVPEGNETLTAVWEKYYTITFDLNGGSFKSTGDKTTKKVVAGAVVTDLPGESRMLKDGYLFTGWLVKDTQERAVNNAFVPTGDVTLVAEWSEYWTITYDVNGGTLDHNSDYYKFKKVEKGSSVFLNSNGYSKDGYGFMGWCDNPEGTGKVYTGRYFPTKDITLYAKWSNGYQVTLDAGEGWFSRDEHVRVINIEPGSTVDSLDEPYWSGGGFAGWYLDQEYTQLVNKAYRPTADVTLYAKWAVDGYVVRIHAGGPYYYDSERQEYVSEAQIIVPRGASVGYLYANKGGYQDVWYMDAAYTLPFDSDYVPESDMDLYVKYVKEITISWDGNGGRDRSGNRTGIVRCGQGERAQLPQDAFMRREGYSFAGWLTADGKQVSCTTQFYESTSIKAQWVEGHKIVLDPNGGEMPVYAEERYFPSFFVKTGQECGMSYEPQKAGYGFAGWKNENTGAIESNLYHVTIDRDTTFTAQWTETAYKITFHAGEGAIYNGFTDQYEAESVVWIAPGKLYDSATTNIPQRQDGETFLGWSLTEGGSIVDLNEYVFHSNQDLYAVYGTACTIIFVLNGGTYNTNAVNGTYSVTIGKGTGLDYPQDSMMIYDNHTFAGWYQNADLTGEPIHIPDSGFKPEQNMFLYAKWIAGDVENCTVMFDTQGGSVVDNQTVRKGQTAEAPEAPMKSGCIFKGWYKDPDCRYPYDFSSMVIRDMTLYAGWMETTDLKDAVVEITGTYTYDGSQIIPQLAVRMGTLELTRDIHYVVTAGENINAGEGTVTVSAVAESGYTGSQTVTFTIEKAEQSAAVPDKAPSVAFGTRLSEIVLPDGWTWDSVTSTVGAVGTHSYGITLVSTNPNYKDKKASIEVTVTPRSLEGAVITLIEDEFTYTGEAIQPAIRCVTVSQYNVSISNYTVTYENNVNAGTGKVIVTGCGNYTGTAEKTFIIRKAHPNLSVGNREYHAVYGDTLGDIKLDRGWAWADESQETGDVTGTAGRRFPANFTTYEGCNYDSAENVELKVVVAPRTLLEGDVSVKEEFMIYDGKEKEVTITVTCNGRTLVENTDYTVTYRNNIEIGDADVIVTGKGNYTGEIIKTFRIIKDPYAIEEANVVLSPNPAVHTGKAIEPDTTVTLMNETLERGTHYEVSYSNNINIGCGIVEITGIDPYHGTKTVSFRIIPGETFVLQATYGDKLENVTGLPEGWTWKIPDQYVGDVTPGNETRTFEAAYALNGLTAEAEFQVKVEPKHINRTTVTVDGQNIVYHPNTPAEPEVAVTDPDLNTTLVKDTDYEVTYRNNAVAGEATVEVTGINNYTGMVDNSFVIQHAKPNPEVGSDKLKEDEMHLTIKDEPFFLYITYAGDGELTVASGDENVFKVEKKLNGATQGQDGELTVTGIGNALLTVSLPETAGYEAATLTYRVYVEPAAISEENAELEKTAYDYTGEQIRPQLSVSYNSEVLNPGTDYTVEYGANINAGSDAGTVTIQGINDYTGEAVLTFDINKVENPAEVPTAVSAVYGQKLSEIAVNGGWQWKNPENYVGAAGSQQHEVVLPETDNYLEKTGQVTVQVAKKALTEEMVALEYERTGYNGKAKEPAVTVTDGELITTDDYEAVYADNLERGTATVTVTAKGNYDGVVVKHFEIEQGEIQNENITVNGTCVYDGTQKQPDITVAVDGSELVRDVDYTVSYGTNIHAGTEAGSVFVTGIGNYRGEVEKHFEILKAENMTAAPEPVEAEYGTLLGSIALSDGWAWRTPENPVGNVGTNEHEIFLAESEDYLEKTAELPVTVTAKLLEESMVTVKDSGVIYDGTEKMPVVEVTDNGLALSALDYQAVYSNNVHAGLAEVKISGRRNYTGEVEKTFVIQKAAPVITAGSGTEVVKYLRDGSFALNASINCDGMLTYKSSNELLATVDATGKVTLLNVGEAVITILYHGDHDYEVAALDVAVTVKRNPSSESGGSGSSDESDSTGGSGGTGSSVVSGGSVVAGSGAAGSQTMLPPGFTGETRVINHITMPAYVVEGTWSKDEAGFWSFRNAEGVLAADTWQPIYNNYADVSRGQMPYDWFYFDGNGRMMTGWYTGRDGHIYYLNPVSDNRKGAMITGWYFIDGAWYYFNEQSDGTRGRMFRNEWTPDGYYVDSEGKWTGEKKEN
ncbi:MAG: InlB B-repeat-containing protein [Eubacteriales bacterium]|nr:InlB B-repeat-containing protein [Eubacteriales bacterium]